MYALCVGIQNFITTLEESLSYFLGFIFVGCVL
jgi:hypothetical protein